MIILNYDIILDDVAFQNASDAMAELKKRAEALKEKLQRMYHDLTTALDTPAGKQVEITAGEVLIEPIDNLLLVIEHISGTLAEIIGTGYYKDVFIKYEELNQSIQFNQN